MGMLKKWHVTCLLALMTMGMLWGGSTASAQDASALDAVLHARWNTQEVVAVEGKIAFRHAKKLEFGLSLGYLPNDDYANIFPILLDVAYHIDEFWAVGLRGSLLMAHGDTKLKRFLQDHQPNLDVSMLYEEQLGDVTFMAAWHPAYGKWTAGLNGLGAFDWGLLAGLGVVIVDAPDKTKMARKKTAHFEGVLGTDAHFFFAPWVALRFEASIRLYQGTERFMAPCFLGLGVSFYVSAASPEEND